MTLSVRVTGGKAVELGQRPLSRVRSLIKDTQGHPLRISFDLSGVEAARLRVSYHKRWEGTERELQGLEETPE